MFTGQTDGMQPTVHPYSGYWHKDRWIDGFYDKKVLCVLIWICITREHVRMTIHGVPSCSHSLRPSPFSISPTLLSDKRMGLCANKKTPPGCCPFFHQLSFRSSFLFSFPLTKTRFIRWLDLPTGREPWREVQRAPQHTYFLFISLLDFSRPGAKPFSHFSLKPVSSAGDKGIVYCSLLELGLLE